MLTTNDQVALPKGAIINFSALFFMFLEQESVGETYPSVLGRGTLFTHALSVGVKMAFFGHYYINYSREKR
jgi:hypothetical protein